MKYALGALQALAPDASAVHARACIAEKKHLRRGRLQDCASNDRSLQK